MKQYPFLAIWVILLYIAGFVVLVGGIMFAAVDEEPFYLVIGLALAPSFLVPADLLRLLIDMRLSTQVTADVQYAAYKAKVVKDTLKPPKKSLNLPRIDPNGKPKRERRTA